MKLKIENLTYKIGDFLILDRVTAEMSQGDAVGLIGPNGAGKTTLANIISGLLTPSSGRILLNNNELTDHSPTAVAVRGGISRMFQSQHLAWNLSTLENVLVGFDTQSDYSWSNALFRSRSSEKIEDTKREQAMELLGRVNLATQAEISARELSFGQQRLLALARALAHPSNLLLLDEPFTGVKSNALQLIISLLKEELHSGRMLLIIDHSLSAVNSIANKIWFMEKGKLTPFSDFPSLLRSESFVHSYLGFGGIGENTSSVDFAPDSAAARVERLHSHIPDVTEEPPFIMNKTKAEEGHISSSTNHVVLAMQSLSGGYGNRVIVKNVSLALSKGDVFCLIGLNGSGKSTLLRLIAGIAQRFTGSISLEGVSIDARRTDERVRKGVRLLPQEHRLFRNISVKENLQLSALPVESKTWVEQHLSLFGTTPRYIHSQILIQLQREFNGFDNRMAGTLSGGEQAKVALRQLEYGSPKLMLLDEPTSGIDGVGKSALRSMIERWKDEGIAVLIVEHDLEFVLSVATRIAILVDGRLNELPSLSSLTPDRLLRLSEDSHN